MVGLFIVKREMVRCPVPVGCKNSGDLIQIYTDVKPKPYHLAGSGLSPRQGGGLGVGQNCKRGFAASITTGGDVEAIR